MTTNSSAAGNLYQARIGPNFNTNTPETRCPDVLKLFWKWMNEWCIYIAHYCVFSYTQSPLQSCSSWWKGPLLNHHQCAASTWMMLWLPQDNGASALTTHQLQVERRESHRANQVDGIIGRPWLTRASGGNLARTPGLHPTLYEKCNGIFNDYRESGPRFNVSSERRCSFTV